VGVRVLGEGTPDSLYLLTAKARHSGSPERKLGGKQFYGCDSEYRGIPSRCMNGRPTVYIGLRRRERGNLSFSQLAGQKCTHALKIGHG
jgi:hypothetical protein